MAEEWDRQYAFPEVTGRNMKEYERGIFMRDAETTIGNLVDKQTVAFIGVADEEDFPLSIHAGAMPAPRKRRDKGVLFYHQYLIQTYSAVP